MEMREYLKRWNRRRNLYRELNRIVFYEIIPHAMVYKESCPTCGQETQTLPILSEDHCEKCRRLTKRCKEIREELEGL